MISIEVTIMKKTWAVRLGILLLGAVLAGGCAAKEAQAGDVVSVNYTITLDDGTIYETSIGREPLKFTVGQDEFLPAFEEAVIGMRIGDSKIINLPPEKAYGPRRPELVQVVSRSMLPEGVEPVVGQPLQALDQDGAPFTVIITEVTEDTVTADSNLPLAGKNLTFNIELLAIGETLASDDRANQPNLGWLLLAPAVLLASGLTFFYFRNRRRPVSAARKSVKNMESIRPASRTAKSAGGRLRPVLSRMTARPRAQERKLLDELAHLDDDFEGGKIVEETYRRARAQKKAQLLRLMQKF